mmetsp:Transcript_45827/g.71810  ORF Transcript_45827/g.71810 Transcript_45827/m.71810 type:complete len:86 (-) Transcript_45827:97-354(-)|eukprot:CAMPEP_0184326680 /NCGR_PEP_ID=MMETSP1049-20130417/142689_1 /TAXON_ID=77928 /ORGANISM="Proteomonas sulcata, Strain CCMP704" /LENGTH=85 /DNA_ID=CAMNT_0026648883 /DNA_START=229 /DNA_END=486 /DNA_ORIENTATION=-
MISKILETTKLWSMQGLGASTTPAAVSGDSFYVNNEGPRTVLPSALSGGSRRSGGSTGLSTEEKMFDSSFKADPTLHESRRGKIL